MRRAAGHATVGRKIGFANKALWRVHKLDTLVWAHMYDDTVRYAAASNTADVPVTRMTSPHIEPEIVFKLKRPLAGGDPAAALEAVEWLALGFEVVDCVYADWKFQPADFLAAYGLHAGLVVGEPRPVEPAHIPALADALATFTVTLTKNGQLAAEGGGKNVLRSPALCLAEVAEGEHGGVDAARRRRADQHRRAHGISIDCHRPDVDRDARWSRPAGAHGSHHRLRSSECRVPSKSAARWKRPIRTFSRPTRCAHSRRSRTSTPIAAASWRPASRAGPRGRAIASASRFSIRPRRSRGRTSRPGRHATARSPAARFPRTCSASGFRAPGPAARPARRPRRACATSPTRCSLAPTAGCSTARTRSARSRRCRWTTSAISSWRFIAIRCF